MVSQPPIAWMEQVIRLGCAVEVWPTGRPCLDRSGIPSWQGLSLARPAAGFPAGNGDRAFSRTTTNLWRNGSCVRIVLVGSCSRQV